MDAKLTIEGVHALSAGTSTLGTLKLTNFHIIFSAPVPSSKPPSAHSQDQPQKHHSPPVRHRESWITYPIISHCTFRPTPPSSGQQSSIRLRCRDFNYVCFNIPNDKQGREAFDFIRNRTCRLGCIEKLYAFSYGPPRLEKDVHGWDIYDARAEFRRQGISEKLPDRGWRISSINLDYSFSPTYPDVLVVPSKISDNVLKYAGQFRSRARIPALTYYHPITQCTITRSSQPLVGVRNNRSIQDERLVSACFSKSTEVFGGSTGSGNATPSPSTGDDGSVPNEGSTAGVAACDGPGSDATSDTERFDDDLAAADVAFDDKTGSRIVGARRDNLIVDARPAINSYAMQMVGKGSENMEYYKCATKMFLSIDNIHVMRDSLNKVIEAVRDADVSPLPPNRDLLAKSGWLKHIRGILAGSEIIAKQVGVSAAHVLIHCSDGWDRTSQLSGLSQIMLDPYFRTIEGFIVLVEKDWLSFGHMFQQRSGHLNHEKWFTVQNDAMAGTKIEPGEGEGRNEVFDNAVASARRFFKKSLSQDKEESDADSLTTADESSVSKTASAEESQTTRPKEISPVFHQFLDATYQLLRQHPARFEYNERFLRRLLYHLYSCQYGTFLYNNERQRRDAHVREKTSSVWDYFLSRRQDFVNPEYKPDIDGSDRQEERLLFPRLKDIRWWHQVFNRTDEDMNAALNAAAAAEEKCAAYHSTVAAGLASVVMTQHGDEAGTLGTADGASDSPRRGASPMPPPSLQSSQSAAGELETPPTAATARSMLANPPDEVPASLNRSASAHEAGTFTVLRDGIAGLGLGQKVGGVFGSLGVAGALKAASGPPQHDGAGGEQRRSESFRAGSSDSSEQEMKDMS
ncbi:protein phosphatase [Grosmannia clavigera kw1407]|uniref:Protein phosphatase n=1 Tax=Grosmannia clavigera (strain kw1407 / UAMH 11150) TaxID=655863 RepID=F0XCQ4_GROCL|nr:protein phosphatase [Grosmannia clavigera kw1407]EFX03655.1 protein phosphatase [Grosmannia clavigera kw1407]